MTENQYIYVCVCVYNTTNNIMCWSYFSCEILFAFRLAFLKEILYFSVMFQIVNVMNNHHRLLQGIGY